MKKKNIKNLFKRLLEKNPRPTTELNYSNNFTLLLAVVLSAQMTDTGVNKVTKKIFSLADSPEKILKLGEIKIKSLIKTINFFNTKAKNIIKLSGGLGLIDSIIVDQHFRERNRLFRLATAISINPHKIGVGIDENTAIHIINGEVGNIYGANSVTILDGRGIEHSGHEEGNAKDPIALTNMKFHSLPEGWKYNFNSYLPSKSETADVNN